MLVREEQDLARPRRLVLRQDEQDHSCRHGPEYWEEVDSGKRKRVLGNSVWAGRSVMKCIRSYSRRYGFRVSQSCDT